MTISATTQGIKPGVCLSTNRPVNPFDGQVIYMTDVDQTAVWDGSQWTVLAPIASGRNVIINGAMQVAQRGTSSTGIVNVFGYFTADRFVVANSNFGAWTQTVENDAPTGSGLRKSLKMLCTTADASPAAADNGYIAQLIEGQNLQQFAKGTASAKSFALSFWVKSNVTGTYIASLYDGDNTRSVSASYTISASATWEKKTIIFPADTTGAFDNDNAASLEVQLGLGFGSNFTSGTLQTSWGANVTANGFVGQTNVASAINNYWQVTGVQLEAGAVATPFEFEDIGTTLAKCQRYFCSIPVASVDSYALAGAPAVSRVFYPVQMRALPTLTTGTLIAQGNNTGAFTFDAATSSVLSGTLVITASASARAYYYAALTASIEL